MSRRGWVFTIILIGMAVIAVLILRFNKEDVASSASAENGQQKADADSATESSGVDTSSTDASPKKSPSSVSETTSSSSDPSSGRSRGVSTGRELPGKKLYNASGARTYADPAFAGTHWKVWAGVTASPRSQEKPSANVIGEVNGYYLVNDGVDSSSENFDPARPMVVVAQNGTNTAGVVTGTFSVVLEEGASANFLTQSPQIKVVGAFPNIQTYFVTSNAVPFNLKEFKDALSEAPEVKDVQMEILDRQYEKF